MEVYEVGGAVRDALLGLPVQDHDWVVVGATPAEMIDRGFKPVGKDFPVFLHPDTHEEYALARTERKTAPGYKGFVIHADPSVSLEQDLERRDLTINAIARAADGSLIDPHGGISDLNARRFRHVSAAFAEDPVRILRVARFSARFADFEIAPETLELMRRMVAAGEVDHLVAERVWQELARGLMESRPDRMIAVLQRCGALARILPELDHMLAAQGDAEGSSTLHTLRQAAARMLALPARWACLLRDLGGSDAAQLSDQVKAPSDCRDLAVLLAREHRQLACPAQLSPEEVIALFERCDVFRRPERFQHALDTLSLSSDQNVVGESANRRPDQSWQAALRAARAVNAGAIARQCANQADIPAQLRACRIAAVAEAWET